MTAASTDRIEKQVLLRTTPARVWRALTDVNEFNTWFRVKLEGPFAVGRRLRGKITAPGHEHVTMDVTVERMEAERLFSFRWHPGAVDPKVDYSTEPTTLVEFRLEKVEDGTLLTVVESGFDRLPAARRDEALRLNTRGWESQLRNVAHHVAG